MNSYFENAPLEEALRQKYFIDISKKLREEREREKGVSLSFHVTTFGCQMNARDSEKLEGILYEIGFTYEPDEEKADLVVFNTCTVRDNANQKFYGHLGTVFSKRNIRNDRIVAICGCMMQEPTQIEKIKKSYPKVSIIFGTHNIYKLAELLVNYYESNRMVIDVWQEAKDIVEDIPNKRKYSFKSGVNIMFGCNNFCSYCIVPYVRGRERSREAADIIAEIEALAQDGVKEIMLLGQNVNSYGKNLDNPISFAELLRMVEKVEGIERIRFMTSHPKDLSDELIEVMASSKKICRHLHLPLQSGSTRILKEMNRRYTKEQYLALVGKIKERIPDISITTDIIVGFPGETHEDVDETIDVIKQVHYDGAFTFIYSKRTGTPAAAMENQVSREFVKEEFDRVLAQVLEESKNSANKYVGNIETVLVEEVNEQDASLVTGRMSNNSLVHFAGDESLIGNIVSVKLIESKGFYYLGEMQ